MTPELEANKPKPSNTQTAGGLTAAKRRDCREISNSGVGAGGGDRGELAMDLGVGMHPSVWLSLQKRAGWPDMHPNLSLNRRLAAPVIIHRPDRPLTFRANVGPGSHSSSFTGPASCPVVDRSRVRIII
jgi:hypothetical protein